MPWTRRLLRDSRVWARARADGSLDQGPDGRVDVLYKYAAGSKIYRAATANLTPDPEGPEIKPDLDEASLAPAPDRGTRRAPPGPPPPDAIVVYTDGACSGNPGPMGVGAVVTGQGIGSSGRLEVSKYLGTGTNNIAELTAIEVALDAIPAPARGRLVLVHADSSYAIGLLSQGWKAKANQELVARLRAKLSTFPNVRFVKVAGHAGVPENERCDELARQAIKGR